MIIHNTFRDRLDEGKPTMGTHFMFVDADVPEMIGDLGLFDYGEFTAEYSAFDMKDLYHMARAAQCGNNLPLMIKPDQESQGYWAQAALGAGFKAVLFTDIRTPEDVDLCHLQLRPDTPEVQGYMGVKLRRPALTSYGTESYGEDLKAHVFCIMIEKGIAVDNLDPILERAKQKGVDMTQWGPADFSFSRGMQQGSKEVREFEELVIAKSIEYGVPPRIEIGAAEQAKRYIDLGVRHFCIGWDRFIYRQALGSLGNEMRKVLDTI
jgi:4-hydroxy-2-oxoheptanedioate aldolase